MCFALSRLVFPFFPKARATCSSPSTVSRCTISASCTSYSSSAERAACPGRSLPDGKRADRVSARGSIWTILVELRAGRRLGTMESSNDASSRVSWTFQKTDHCQNMDAFRRRHATRSRHVRRTLCFSKLGEERERERAFFVLHKGGGFKLVQKQRGRLSRSRANLVWHLPPTPPVRRRRRRRANRRADVPRACGAATRLDAIPRGPKRDLRALCRRFDASPPKNAPFFLLLRIQASSKMATAAHASRRAASRSGPLVFENG